MELERITVTPSTPNIGAEIGNIDLTKPLTNQQVQDVHEALLKYQVIFFRNQPINFEQHTNFAKHFSIHAFISTQLDVKYYYNNCNICQLQMYEYTTIY